MLAVSVSTIGAGQAGAATADDEQLFVYLINQVRTDKGLAPLQVHGELTAEARSWSAKMAADDSLAHSPNMAKGISAPWTVLGENVGTNGNHDLQQLFQAFVASPSHYQNLIDPRFQYLGVGVVHSDNGKLWTTHRFMATSAAPPTTTPPTTTPTTAPPTIKQPTTAPATTKKPTTTAAPTTKPSTSKPSTSRPPAPATTPTTKKPTTSNPPTTEKPVSADQPTAPTPTTTKPTTAPDDGDNQDDGDDDGDVGVGSTGIGFEPGPDGFGGPTTEGTDDSIDGSDPAQDGASPAVIVLVEPDVETIEEVLIELVEAGI